jgi:hypothetical protein
MTVDPVPTRARRLEIAALIVIAIILAPITIVVLFAKVKAQGGR